MVKRLDALDLAQEDERVEEVMREYKLLELGELTEFIEVRMVYYQVKAHVGQVHLLDNVVKFRACQYLKGVAVNVKNLVALDLGVATLNKALVSLILALGILGVLPVLLGI